MQRENCFYTMKIGIYIPNRSASDDSEMISQGYFAVLDPVGMLNLMDPLKLWILSD